MIRVLIFLWVCCGACQLQRRQLDAQEELRATHTEEQVVIRSDRANWSEQLRTDMYTCQEGDFLLEVLPEGVVTFSADSGFCGAARWLRVQGRQSVKTQRLDSLKRESVLARTDELLERKVDSVGRVMRSLEKESEVRMLSFDPWMGWLLGIIGALLLVLWDGKWRGVPK